MNQISLSENFIQVADKAGGPSFGGNQGWFSGDKFGNLSRQGCGVIAAVDTLLYLSGCYDNSFEKYSHEVDGFCQNRRLAKLFMKEISFRKYDNFSFAIGILPIQISGFLNRQMKSAGRKIHFKWNGIHGHRDLFFKMKSMISRNIPVIWSLYSHGKQIKLYVKNPADRFVYSGITVNNHYVTATAVYEACSKEYPRMIEISSWGKRYYIDFDEYLEYVGNSLINKYCSNIIYIKTRENII